MKKKSAKDVAFENERIKYRQAIRLLTEQVNNQQKEIEELKETICDKEQIIESQEEWINRLLEYTEVSKEDLKKLIESEKNKIELIERIKALGLIGKLY